MVRVICTSFFSVVFLFGGLYSQILPEFNPEIRLKRATTPIVLDGKLEEPSWFNGVPAEGFWQYFPSDTTQADMQTEIYMTYDDDYLYVATRCYAAGRDYIVPSLKRDYRAGGNDNISLMFDCFNDRTNALLFGINPFGVRREAVISGGGSELSGFSTSWDNKWHGTAEVYDDHWIAELAIPFKTLRFKEGESCWGFNCYRFDTQSNEQSTWIQIPRNQWIFNLAFMGEMKWEEPLKKAGANVSVIPYSSINVSRDFEEGGDTEFDFDVGGDVKVGVTSGLNLDLTVNPDFSQVEADRQLTNLSRFELFFPEQRQFFLENADLFSGFGTRSINPFFSRRIGVTQDTSTGQNLQNTILFGARLSGKLDNNWRVGLLNMQTAKQENNGLPGFNYTVMAVQRKVFSRSNIGLIFVNKQAINPDNFDEDFFNPYNRVIGLDYNLSSKDNSWTGKTFYHHSFSPEGESGAFAHGARLNYNKRRYRFTWHHQWIGEDYKAEVGFVPRQDFFRINPEWRLFFYPSSSKINRHGPGMEYSFYWRPGFGRTDHEIELFWDISFVNNSRFSTRIMNEYTYLFDPFDPTNTESEALPGDTDYNYTTVSASYSSDSRKKVSYRIEPVFGQFFNGKRLGIGGNLTYRYQPFGSITFNFNVDHINLPQPYNTTTLFLLGPRIDFTFSKNIFLTTFIQYNSQIDNVNINARFQWRFKPVSDFFLVYTDNYGIPGFNAKSRAIIGKVTYWLNL